MEPREMEDQSQFSVEVVSSDEIDVKAQQELLELLKAGYGERWLGEENFRDVILRNCTKILRIYSGDKTAAALVFDNNRISDIAVHPDFQGKGLGVRLFAEAAIVNPKAWVSVGVNAEAMLATVTDEQLNFLPVGEQEKIEELFQHTNRARENYHVNTEKQKIPFLIERLTKKGIKAEEFTTFVRGGATHGLGYYQILFQNKT